MKILSSAVWIVLLAISPAQAAEPYPEIKWEALVPKGWDPARDLKNLNLGSLQDSDPRAMEALDKLKAMWDNAPAEPALNGRKIRLAGYALPLERKDGKVTEFLLVPYYGACIHSPPPPANQIIHAKSSRPLAGVKMMEPLWVHGTLTVQRGETTWGVAGYRLTVERIAPYEAAPKK
ncbi:MAG: DUF3299 domain-containing protein [Gammaproteobacteria bacterium]|nr:DUF3299 domain-containing protein [Rhodocyclaceae bacterium]MBU3910709.1 DUF3299 domain-containing protein [Gammaproteobacteria bacterium]MBU3988505.1 DUF3299 domain-containing protein [Gammaproteobacteria bacterium]MBU4003418.1 DUF3299 domain-containing protein [Gammaproteobacteria bacterium]MBU4021889.1 DUF3299 domain-containing protein [Gammaproteobacteria bacterium]